MKDKIITYLFICFLLTFSILEIVLPDKKISNTERRKLSNFPKFEISNKYINKLEKYTLDHFPFRDSFRSIKAKFNYDILNRLENNKIYLHDNYIFKSNYPTNYNSIDNFINKTKKLEELFNDNKIYMLIVPDKNYYLNDSNFLNIDYNYLYNEINKLNYKFIDIRNIMQLNDYYETDTHWKQENLNKVIQELDKKMHFNYSKIDYKYNTYDNFYGVYYGESALKRKPEKLTYLTNDVILNSKVKYLEHDNFNSVYNLDKLKGLDSYEVYLDGASSFIEIYNDKVKNKELVIFRDSFGSSLTPLLINYYSKITIIDNRYINSEYIKQYINFDKQDILFLYSTLIVNNSSTLKG